MSQQPPSNNWPPGHPGTHPYPPQSYHGPAPGQPSHPYNQAQAPYGTPSPGGWQHPPPGSMPHPQYPQYPPQNAKPSQGTSIIRTVVSLVVLAILLGMCVILYGSFLHSGRSSSAGSVLNSPVSILRSPQVMVDEDLVVTAGGSQMRPFSIEASSPVKLVVEGKQDTAKGFNVWVMDSDDWQRFKRKRQDSHYIPDLSAPQTRAFSQTSTLSRGTYCIVIENSENIFNSMTVHVKLIVDPD